MYVTLSPLRVFTLCAALLSTHTVSAQAAPATQAAPPEHIDPAENARRINAAGQFFAGLVLESATALSVVGVGLGFAAAASEPSDDGGFIDGQGARVFVGTTTVAALLFIPPMTALGVHAVARRGVSPGRYRAAWKGSLGCGAGLFALTIGVTWPMFGGGEGAGAAAGATALGVSFVGFLAGALVGERRSTGPDPHVETKARALRVVPSVSFSERHGASLGLAGTF